MGEESPIAGLIEGLDDRPVAGATVRARVNHFDFRMSRPDPAPVNDSYGFPQKPATDAAGRFAFRGLTQA